MTRPSQLDGATGRRWRGQSPEERRDLRRGRLLTSALELFGTQGYAATSLVALCAHAGVSPRHFYECFADREQLLTELYDQLVAQSESLLRTALESTQLDPVSRVAAGLAATVDYHECDPRRGRVLLLEVVGVSPALDSHRREVIRGFARLVEGQYQLLAQAGRVPRREFRLVAIGVVGAVNELLTEWLLTQPRPRAAILLPALDAIVGGAFGPASGPA